jgi:hypothetical protein
MWAVTWSRAIPFVGHAYAASHVCSFTCKHTSCCYLGKHRTYTKSSRSRCGYSSRIWTICPFHDPEHIRLWSSSVPCQVLTNPKHCFSNGGLLWNCNFASYPLVLGASIQIGTRKQGSCLGNLHIVLDQCAIVRPLCEVLFFMCKI